MTGGCATTNGSRTGVKAGGCCGVSTGDGGGTGGCCGAGAQQTSVASMFTFITGVKRIGGTVEILTVVVFIVGLYASFPTSFAPWAGLISFAPSFILISFAPSLMLMSFSPSLMLMSLPSSFGFISFDASGYSGVPGELPFGTSGVNMTLVTGSNVDVFRVVWYLECGTCIVVFGDPVVFGDDPPVVGPGVVGPFGFVGTPLNFFADGFIVLVAEEVGVG